VLKRTGWGPGMFGSRQCVVWGGLLVAACTGPDMESTLIRDDRGGEIIDYGLRTARLRESGEKVRIAGYCASACTLYLSLPSDQICIFPGTKFQFHTPSAVTLRHRDAAAEYMLAKYPPWVKSWIDRHGGLSARLITMHYAYAGQFLNTCTTGE
jgi:hypothetical protein